MSNYTTNAVVNLHINGQQPEQQLARLRENARLLSDAIAKAAAEGNKMELKKLRKELNQVNKDIRAIETASQQVDNVLRRMDSATPSELNKTLRTLQGQLEYIERGSVSWDQHVRKIQLVEREIANVKAQMKTAGDIVQATLRNMNGASPHDLETTIRLLEQDFKQMAVGSTAWKQQKLQIDQLKMALDKAGAAAGINGAAIKKALINIDNASIHDLETALKSLEAKLRTMGKGDPAFGQTKRDLETVKKALDEAKRAATQMHDVMTLDMQKLDKLTPRELNEALKQLKERLKDAVPNTKEWDVLQGKINKVSGALDRAKMAASASETAIAKTMRHLNTASPEKLKTTLDVLNKQLSQMRVGSAAWDQQVQKINKVKAALDRAKTVAMVDGNEVQKVLRNIDKASPKQLETTLKALNAQMQNLKRTDATWKKTAENIRRVKKELEQVNRETSNGLSRWDRLNVWLNNTQVAIMGVVAALTGVVMAARNAVKAYAEMAEQMANTRKYTGLSEDMVNTLNENFKKIDTRTGREKLNEFAQEAGRLGKNTLESVQGYVEAADIINVALVDLGDGATQTIAKISNIFGIEDMLGTRDAMLSVGSTVNVLSQNCTASKPYIVEFTQRMAGVGAQAKMTIPEIMAFAATLDANGQKVEMSASALSRLIMKLFQDPKEIAQQVGLDVAEFTETLERSTNEGLMMFLNRLHQIGDKDALAALSPLFKDLGMDGIRMSQVLATLATHLDMVKWEQGEANKAFNEGISATREYNIFNNTAQATLDKAKYRLHELAVELGEKLMPVMHYAIRTSSLMLRVVSSVVNFFIEYKTVIFTTVTAIAAYTVVVEAAAIKTKLLAAWTATANVATKAWALAVNAAKAAQVALELIIAKVTGNVQLHTAAMQKAATAQLALKSGYAALAAAAVLLIAGLVKMVSRLNEASEGQKALNKIQANASQNMVAMEQRLKNLTAAAKNETLSLKERLSAVNQLNKIIPNYNAQLDKTTHKYRANKQALDAYLDSLRKKYELEGAKEMLIEIGRQKAQLIVEKGELEADLAAENAKQRELESHNSTATQAYGTAGVTLAQTSAVGSSSKRIRLNSSIAEKDRAIAALNARESAITAHYGKAMQEDAAAGTPTYVEEDYGATDYSGLGGGGDGKGSGKGGKDDKSKEDKFAKEKAWREEQEALNRIAYGMGLRDYEDYQQRMLDIAEEFYQKELEHTDLSELERLQIEAEYQENRIKQREEIDKLMEAERKKLIEEENAAYNTSVANEMQRYVDGKITLKEYEEATEQLELEHLRKMVLLTKEGTDERLKAEQAYTKRLFEDQKKRQKALEDYEKQYADKLKSMKESYFGDNEDERLTKYDADLYALNEVYERELAAAGNNAKEKLRIDKAYEEAKLALQIKYGFKSKRAMEKANEKLAKWLESDGGKAWTESFDTIVQQMGAIFSGLSDIIQTELEIQTSALEKKYDAEISAAEGNQYKVNKLEKEKEEQTAALKKAANKKLFAMQVIQAVAQTATSALNAYSSAAAIPMVGWIMAPVAASMALAAGAIQIAAIKKQQQASEAQGYAEGGYTPKGRKDQEVGVVHAGEWVASQELLANPEASAIIKTLDVAQSTGNMSALKMVTADATANNTMASLRADDVTRSITAPQVLASQNSAMMEHTRKIAAGETTQRVVVQNMPAEQSGALDKSTVADLSSTIASLNSRLNEPFVTVNTITGDQGIKKAQDEYARLIRNKTPKSRR